MPVGKDVGGGRRGGSTTKKNAFCSFCRKSYRDVGPLSPASGKVYSEFTMGISFGVSLSAEF